MSKKDNINNTYIPKGKNISTVHGCICKNEYKTDAGKTKKETCTDYGDPTPWCRTVGKCGFPETGKEKKRGKMEYYDYCTDKFTGAGGTFLDSDITYGKNYFSNQLKGILFYFVVFVVIIPITLYKLNYKELLEVYMPNFDLLATALSFKSGTLGGQYFRELYYTSSSNILGYFSSLLINYLSLLGLTYLVARRVHLTKSLLKGWGIGFVMLIATYLIPNEFISYIQDKFATILQNYMSSNNSTSETKLSKKEIYTLDIIIFIVGLSIAAMFILVEKFLLTKHKIWLDPLVKRILQITNFLDRI